jgi:beta-phosphoglucomutase-like phosphatase (HAD superfamily)
MTIAAAAKESEGKASQGDAGAILFEMEGLAAGGRRATFDAISKAFAEQDVKFSPALFARLCLHPAPRFYIADLPAKIGAKKVNADKLLEQVEAALTAYFSSSKSALHPGLARLLDVGKEQALEGGAISALSEDVANALHGHLGLAGRGVRLFTHADIESNFPRADVWMKVARQLGKSARACIVVTDHMAACKSALAASMKCVVVPNEFTAHQDFCGADLILDSWDEMSAKEILAALSRAG